MTSPMRYSVLGFIALTAACGEQGNDPAAPSLAIAPPLVQPAVSAPALLLTSHALYYCYHPGMTRNCVILKRQLRIKSSGSPLRWTASKNQPWIVVSPAAGTTPTTLTISVDPRKLTRPPVLFAGGTVTISAVGALYSPQKVQATVNYLGGPLSLPSLAFSDSAIGFCFFPASSRGCVRLAEHVLLTSTGAQLPWKVASSDPWIVVQPSSGTTDTDVRVSVDLAHLPPRNGAKSISGSLTVSATGARNSPLPIPVRLQFYSSPPPQ